MKKVLSGLFCVLLLAVGGGLYYVYANLDALVKRAIETAGTSAAGTPVRVASVDVDPLGGSAIVRGFTLANPAGFSDAPLLSFDELAVVIDPARINQQNISIVSITALNPHLLYETRGGASNLDAIRERLASGEPAPASTRSAINVDIGSIVIEDIGATVSSDLMTETVEVPLGDIRLQDLSGTPDAIAQQVLRPLLTQLAANAARVALTLLPEDVRAAGAAVRDAAAARLEQAEAAAGDAATRVREGVGNLFRRDADDEAEESAEAEGN